MVPILVKDDQKIVPLAKKLIVTLRDPRDDSSYQYLVTSFPLIIGPSPESHLQLLGNSRACSEPESLVLIASSPSEIFLANLDDYKHSEFDKLRKHKLEELFLYNGLQWRFTVVS